MSSTEKNSGSYWDLLKTANRLLDEGDFASAERHFDLACARRESSPGRVFFTEKLGDGLGRLLRRNRSGEDTDPGRWQRHIEEFQTRFLEQGDQTVRQAVHTAELRPEDDARKNQPLLERALYLVGRSTLFAEEPTSAVPILKGLFRTARRTGRPFAVDLVRHDLPLTEEDRLWLARRGGELVVEFQEQGAMVQGSRQAEEWARVCLQLLNPRYFGHAGRLEEERCWVEAITNDHLLGKAADSVDAYRTYLEQYPAPGERADEARVRLLELLGNIDDLHFQVPHYEQALAAMQSAGLSAGSTMGGRYESALTRLEFRRPDPEPGVGHGPAWASLAIESDGRLAAVYWWKDQPRDVAYWRPGEDPGSIQHFLEPCAGRLMAGSREVVNALQGVWNETPSLWSVQEFVVALLEPELPAEGLGPDVLLRLGMGETAAWRSGWSPDHGHVHLEPPRRSTLVETWQGGPAGSSLVTGLLVLAIRARLAQADPCLRAGIGHLARRRDPAAGFLYEFVTAGSADTEAVDGTFQPWTLPLLWTRPDPFGWAASGPPHEGRLPTGDTLARPDLGRNDLAIVSTGDPASVLAAWGDGRQKWRIVLDRLDRLESLSRVAGGAIGPVTLIPRGGRVHALDGALEMLEGLLDNHDRDEDPVAGLLPLFHWVRLVESHNGDLLDFQEVRPRPGTPVPLYQAYAQLTASLPSEAPRLDEAEGSRQWSTQFSQRVRKAGFVAGMVENLLGDAERLDSLWGVFEGSDASWVFLDSAAVHWSLLNRQEAAIHELHTLLQSRGHRHLSLLTGAVWLRQELEELLATWLQAYGSAYRVGLTDSRPPRLRLADRGPVPHGREAMIRASNAQLDHLRRRLDTEPGATVVLPAEGALAEFWRDVATGRMGARRLDGFFLDPGRPHEGVLSRLEDLPARSSRCLVVPVLRSLEADEVPIALEDSPAAWARADGDRREFLRWRRKLCGLEMAGLLAGSWNEVEILDPRWWRLLKPVEVPDGPADVWTGARAAVLAAPQACTTFELSAAAGGAANWTPEAVRQWWSEQPAALPPALPENPVPTPAVVRPEAGRPLLLLGDCEPSWRDLIAVVRRQWEDGILSSWILFVGERLPGGGADLVAASWTEGMSAWPLEGGAVAPAPILWVQREDFANPDLEAFLKKNPPTWILVRGLADWLPGPAGGRQVAAQALRVLLERSDSGLILQADHLLPPWQSFLARATGAELLPADHSDPAGGREIFPGDADALVRLRHLLASLDTVLPSVLKSPDGTGRAPVSARQLVSVRWLALLAGTEAEVIRRGIRLLRWAGRLAGDSLTLASGGAQSAGGARITHALLIPRRFAELENTLLRLESHLPVLLPLWLGSHRPGLATWVDLAFPPLEIDPEDLILLDSYLGMVAGDGVPGLAWEAGRGFLTTTRRRLSCSGDAGAVLQELLEGLALFRRRVKDLMATAVETGEGFLVDTGLADLRSQERTFLATGAAMGLWRWLGPVDTESLHLVDLLSLAESPTVQTRDAVWRLLEDLQAGFAEHEAGPAAAVSQDGRRPSGWKLGGLRQLLGGAERKDRHAEVVARVAELLQPSGQSGTLILRGLAGSGRHEAVGRGMRALLPTGEVTVYCPDPEAASVLLESVGPETAARLTDLRIPDAGDIPPVPLGLPRHLGENPDRLVVMCEVQRFGKEARYRIAQLARGCKLLMTVDADATAEPWENLFLTTPRATDILTLEVSRRHAPQLWRQVAGLLPGEGRSEPLSLRRSEGQVKANYAVNLDQCLARLRMDVEAAHLPDRLRLVGPLLSDLDFLAESLRGQGWLTLPERTLAELHLPGVREVLAAATDLLTRDAVALADDPEETEDSFVDGEGADSEAVPEPVLLTGLLLPAETVADWQTWHEGFAARISDLSLREFFSLVEEAGWARSFLAHPEAAARAHDLVSRWADESVPVLADTALWEAWWLSTLAVLRLPVPRERRPLVTLAEAGPAAGLFTPGTLYLCLGSEPWRQHYNVLSRCTDEALILYKERSPLAEEDLPSS